MARYELLLKIASGGMASVYVGRLRGALGFEQLVAIKRPHAHVLEAPDAKRSLLSEARVTSGIRHSNVVSVRDVEETDDSILLVMDYVEGASLLELLAARGDRMETVRAGLRILIDVCAGLQAAHEITGEDGRPLGIVHRDISPHNILVGLDGVGRLADFGIAKSLYGTDPSTMEGSIKGKLGYMAPEYLNGVVDQRNDLFSVGVVLWEVLTGRRLFAGGSEGATMHLLLTREIPSVSSIAPELGTFFDDVVARTLHRDVDRRFARAVDVMTALESAVASSGLAATHRDVAQFVRSQAGDALLQRRARVNASIQGDQAQTGQHAVDNAATEVLPLATPRRSRRALVLVGAVALVVVGASSLLFRTKASAEREPPILPSGSTSIVEPQPAPPSSSAPIAEAPASASAAIRPAPKPRPQRPPAVKGDRPFRNPY